MSESTLRVVLLEAKGNASITHVPNQLQAFQQLIGGYLEHVRIRLPKLGLIDAYIDEEGAIKQRAFTAVLPIQFGNGLSLMRLHGPVLFFGPADAQGHETSLSPEKAKDLADFLCSSM